MCDESSSNGSTIEVPERHTADAVRHAAVPALAAVAAQLEENARLEARNLRLAAEVRDLKEGLEAVEERARSDLGMIGRDETYYQIVER